MSQAGAISFKMVGMSQNSKYILSGNVIFSSQRLSIYKNTSTSMIFQYDFQKMNEEERSAIESQISILRQIRHQNVLKLLNQFQENERYYVVLEYAPLNLRKYIQMNNRCDESTAMKFIEQMLIAYKQALQKNAHPIICPQNIFLSKQHQIKLVCLNAYNFQNEFEQNKNSHSSTNLYLYESPQVLKQQKYSQKSGIWSLGIIMYELIFGKCPYEGQTQQYLIHNIQNKSIDFSTGPVSGRCRQIIEKMLTKDQNSRIDMKQLLNLLQNNNIKPFLPNISNTSRRANRLNLSPYTPKAVNVHNRPSVPNLLTPKDIRPINPFNQIQNKVSTSSNQNLPPQRAEFQLSKVKHIESNQKIQSYKYPNIIPSSLTSIDLSPIKAIQGVLRGKKHTISSNQNFGNFQDLKQFYILPQGQPNKNAKLQDFSRTSISSDQESFAQIQTQRQHDFINLQQKHIVKYQTKPIFKQQQYNKNEHFQNFSSRWMQRININRQQLQKSRSKTKQKPGVKYSDKWYQKLLQFNSKRVL